MSAAQFFDLILYPISKFFILLQNITIFGLSLYQISLAAILISLLLGFFFQQFKGFGGSHGKRNSRNSSGGSGNSGNSSE